MSTNKDQEFESVEEEIQAKGFLSFVSQLSLSTYNNEELISEIASAVSKRNRLLSEDDRSVICALQGSKFFNVQSILCKVIPLLETNPSELIEFVQLLVERGGTDLAANRPNTSFREWCEVSPNRSEDVIQLAKNGNEQARSHLVFALQAKGDFEQAMACLERSVEEQTAGVLALSRMPLDEPQTLAALEKVTALALAADAKTACGITRAAYDIAGKHQSVDRSSLRTILEKHFVSEDPWSWSSPGLMDTFSLMKESVFHAENEEPVPDGI